MDLQKIVSDMIAYLKKATLNNALEKITIGAVISYFFGDKTLALLVFLLIIVDFVTGVVKSKKMGVKVESSRFRDTILKMYVYYSLLLTLGIVEKLTGFGFLLKLGYSFIALTEGKSIIENLMVINPEVKNILDYLTDVKRKNKENKENNNSL